MRIVHLGLGAFHRAHQAALTDAAGGWEITAVAMRGCALADAVAATDGAYGLVVRHPDGPVVREVRAITEGLCLSRDPGAVVARIAAADSHVVTVTVTEKGYGADLATRRLDRARAEVAADLAGDGPATAVGAIATGCAARQAAGLPGLSVLSCDNIPGNGRLLRALVLEMAAARDPGLADWIEASCRFPDAMVDRITPAPDDAVRAFAAEALGRPDPLAVATEPFCQWVIEDNFAGPRPDWETAGVQIVADVAPHETMKLRMLNGAHSAIAYMGLLAGHDFVRQVMADPPLDGAVRRLMGVAATTVSGDLDTNAYAAALAARFANPTIDHDCAQIATDGSQKMPQRIFAPAAEILEAGGNMAPFALATAAWIEVIAAQGPALNDPAAEALAVAIAADDPLTALGALPGLGAGALFADPAWRRAVASARQAIGANGVRRAAAQESD